MKIIQVTYDCSMITIVLDDNQSSLDDIFNVLRESDDSFIKKGNVISYDWSDFKEECTIEDVTDQRGIIHEEHH